MEQGLPRQAHRAQAEFLTHPDQQAENGGMEVHMMMGVDVIECESRRLKGQELSPDLDRELPPGGRLEKITKSGAGEAIAKPAMLVDQGLDLCGRQDRKAIDHDQMQTNAKLRQPPRPFHGIPGGGFPDHQAGRGENAVPVRGLDRLVHRLGKTEIVGGDDEALQAAFSLPHRNLKNSTPSRNWRFITAGLFSMSKVSAAILLGRK